MTLEELLAWMTTTEGAQLTVEPFKDTNNVSCVTVELRINYDRMILSQERVIPTQCNALGYLMRDIVSKSVDDVKKEILTLKGK